jgi:hypothetical protein
VSAARSTSRTRVVVDGSNLATEGRSTPSLLQLDEAVRAYLEEDPKAEVIVVADATFEHRVATSERVRFKEAELAGEIVTPPAGAIGRGDAFILKIAARIGAVVLSNDSFQEFHGEHPWLFDEGRLIGGKPVPGVGWVFTPRLPVRGVKSVRAVKKLTVALPNGEKPSIGATITPISASAKAPKTVEKPAKSTRRTVKAPDKVPEKIAEKTVAKVLDVALEKTPRKSRSAKSAPATKAASTVKAAAKIPAKKADVAKTPLKKVARATKEPASSVVSEPAVALRRGRQPVNPEVDFSAFVSSHRLRSVLDGEVVAFTSHGAIIAVSLANGHTVECYAPTTSLGSPAPARARDVLKRGDKRTFKLTAVDKDRRIAELAIT